MPVSSGLWTQKFPASQPQQYHKKCQCQWEKKGNNMWNEQSKWVPILYLSILKSLSQVKRCQCLLVGRSLLIIIAISYKREQWNLHAATASMEVKQTKKGAGNIYTYVIQGQKKLPRWACSSGSEHTGAYHFAFSCFLSGASRVHYASSVITALTSLWWWSKKWKAMSIGQMSMSGPAACPWRSCFRACSGNARESSPVLSCICLLVRASYESFLD